MLIGDMLNIVGPLKLKEFEWGGALVTLLNDWLREHVVDDTRLLTVDTTGVEARAALYTLPAVDLAELVVLDFDPGSQAVIDTPATPVADIPVLEVAATPEIAIDVMAPAVTAPIEPPAKRAKQGMALVIGGALVTVALVLAMAMSVTTVKSGQMPDSKALESVVQVLGDVVRSYYKSMPQEPTK